MTHPSHVHEIYHLMTHPSHVHEARELVRMQGGVESVCQPVTQPLHLTSVPTLQVESLLPKVFDISNTFQILFQILFQMRMSEH